jgi:ATP/maltotriose-dependent transcriptional regulator MalT
MRSVTSRGGCILGSLGRRKRNRALSRFARSILAAGLSEREVAVLRLLGEGASNEEVASELRIAEGTVKNHLTNVFTKLGVIHRTQAALRARDLGIL